MAREAPTRAGGTLNVADVGIFRIVDLLVDEDNFRMEPNPDQPAAIKAMLKRQGLKLVTLAEDILSSGGLSRGEFLWIAPDPRPIHKGKYVVCEGNRRVTAIKILNEPALAEGTSWAKRFRELGVDFRKSPVTTARAVLYESVDAARPDVYRRHTNDQDGKGLEAWDPFAQDRANKAQGRRRNLSMVVLEYLTTTTIEALADNLGILDRTTNADRLLSTFSKKFSAEFGIKLRSVIPYLDVGPNPALSSELLRSILLKSNVAVDVIKNEGLRVGYLEEIIGAIRDRWATDDDPEDEDADDTGEADDPESEDDGTEDQEGDSSGEDSGDDSGSKKKGGRNPKRDPLNRPTLALTDRQNTLHVLGPRLPGLYKECRDIVVDQRPNAAAMLLRVFLELSCEAYLTHEGVRPPGTRADWSDHGINLDTKIRRILDRMDHDRKAKDLIDAHNGLSDDEGQSHSIKSLHRAMHDRGHVLDPRQIKLAWQRWHPLLRRMHDAIAGV